MNKREARAKMDTGKLGLEALASEALPVKNSGFNDQSIGTVSPLFSTWHMGWPKKWHMALPKSGTSIHVAPKLHFEHGQ